MQFTPKLYSLTAITNMHVGSGKNNYGIIDNLIQRDVVSGHPTINSSSLKGAMREFFSHNKAHATLVREVFGSEPKDKPTNRPGDYRFFPAHLLSMPVRCDALPYVNVTSKSAVTGFLKKLETFGIEYQDAETLRNWSQSLSGEATHFQSDLNDSIAVEALDLKAQKGTFDDIDTIKEVVGDYPVLVSDTQFSDLTSDSYLPVIARNHLENGISQNLWYEQILPRQSRFYFIVLVPNSATSHFNTFNSEIEKPLVQIGGNASIGYGFSKISSL